MDEEAADIRELEDLGAIKVSIQRGELDIINRRRGNLPTEPTSDLSEPISVMLGQTEVCLCNLKNFF